jgi:hypothetical protein
MKLGASPKQVAALGILGLLAAYSFYSNVLTSDTPESAAPRSTVVTPNITGVPPQTPAQKSASERTQNRKMMAGRQSFGEFRPSLKPAREADRPDPMKVDPTLRLELLAKLQGVTMQGGARSLFEMGAATPAPGPDVPKIIPDAKKGPPSKYPRLAQNMGPQPKAPEPTPTPKPPPTPIPLKFYGFSSPKVGGVKRAFFLEGEDIHVAREGELIKKRYKIIRIGVNSVVVEDIEQKHQQTFALEEQPANG